MKGYAYYLYDPAHVAAAAQVDADGRGGAYLVGDSLGLAHPLTAEGILPAVVSGRLAAEAILAGAPADYPARLAAHPLMVDYRRVFRLRHAVGSLRRARPAVAGDRPLPETGKDSRVARLGRRAVATGFAWMFSGSRLPAPGVIDLALAGAERWQQRRGRR
jgi:hypothetical protein